ncbi:MAG: sigma-70 family RNA polymerase sigma factor [Ruminococcaceae bacterium]|nr:sigma-70 family RNA polymerase sigma factor [Oscillospiraceae bacterium]
MVSEYKKKDDIELIHKWRDGDALAFDVLLNRYKKMVRAVSRSYFLVGADNEDLVQEGMIGFYKAICSFDESKQIKFSTFAEMCVERQIMTAVKTATRKKHSPLNNYVSTSTEDGFSVDTGNSDTGDFNVASDESVADPEEIVLKKEQEILLKKEIRSRLSSFENTVFELFTAGMTYREMAECTGRTEKMIDNAVQRIKRKLKSIERGLR